MDKALGLMDGKFLVWKYSMEKLGLDVWIGYISGIDERLRG